MKVIDKVVIHIQMKVSVSSDDNDDDDFKPESIHEGSVNVTRKGEGPRKEYVRMGMVPKRERERKRERETERDREREREGRREDAFVS